MRRHVPALLMCVVALLCGLAAVSAAPAKNLVVAVMPFVAGGDADSDESVLEGCTQMFTDRLAKMKGITLIERGRMTKTLENEDVYADDIDTATAIEIGRKLGADLLVIGSVTRFGLEGESGVSLFGVSVSSVSARVGLSVRLVAVRSGQVLDSLQAQSEEAGTDLSVDTSFGLSFGTKEFEESTMGRALKEAMDDLAGKFKSTLSNMGDKLAAAASPMIAGKVVAVRGSYFVVNLGKKDGVQPQMKLSVYRLEKIEGVSDPVRLPIGTLQVVSVDQSACVTSVLKVEEGEKIQVGDQVEFYPG